MDPRFIPPYHQQQLWAEEVLYLHSLWHQGPPPNPNPSPNPNLHPFNSTKFKKSNKKNKKKWINLQPQSQIEWPVNPSTDPTASLSGWPDPPPYTTAPPPLSPAEQARAAALFLQKSALKSCREFLLKDGSDVDDDEEEDDEEAEAFVFFLGVLRKDEELRGYYVRNWEKGEFFCLVCGGIGVKLGKKYRDCVGLVQHSRAISRTKRRAAHRGFGRAVCSVLGWDINRLPSVNVDRGEGMVQTLAKEVVMQENLQKEDNIKETVEIHDDAHKDDFNQKVKDCIKAKEIGVQSEDLQRKDNITETVEIPDDDLCVDSNEDIIDLKEVEIGIPNENELLGLTANHQLEGSVKKRMEERTKDQVPSSSNPLASQIISSCKPRLDPKPDANVSEDLIHAQATTQIRQSAFGEEQAVSTAVRVQQNGLKACRDFLAKPDSSSDDENDEEEMVKRQSVAFKFFLGLFKMDCNLRNYYETNWVNGEFCCLVCGDAGLQKKYGSCVALVQHSKSVRDTKRRWAHQAFGRAVCQLLGWPVNENPNIVLPPKRLQAQLLEKSAKNKGSTAG